MTEAPHSKDADGDAPGIHPDLIPPDATKTEEKKTSRTPLLVIGGGVLLIAAALFVLFLPLLHQKPTTALLAEPQDIQPAVPESQPPHQINASRDTANDAAAQEIDQLIGTWLQKQAESEAANVTAWGGESYAKAVLMAKECDQRLGDKEYSSAREACEKAIILLGELMSSKDVLLEDAITSGMRAIEQGNSKAAIEYFQQALAINTEEERAQVGLRRAEQLPTVLQFIQDGQTMENSGDLEGALLVFGEAATLDPAFAPAQEALLRVQAVVDERAFQQAISRALQAMAEGRLSAARSALQKAEKIRPGDQTIRALRQQLAQVQLADRLTALRQNAERMEQEERWPEALQSCKEALSLDPHAAFAVSCKERTTARMDLDNRLKAILAKPERLFEDGPRQEARQTLGVATRTTPQGPILTAQIGQIEPLIVQAEAEIEVTIISDDLTEVTIYHVGRLGRFEKKHLVLRTGDYIATGSRNGYRDVRQTLKVRPGDGKMVFTLRCEEPI